MKRRAALIIAALFYSNATAAPLVTYQSPCECQDNHGKHRWAEKNDPPILSVKLEQVTLAHGLYMLLQQYQMLDATAGDFSSEIRRALRFHGLVR